MKIIDISGKKYGKLTVISICREESVSKKLKWMCLCECGKYKAISGNNLRAGSIFSCGCSRGENISISNTVHGLSDSRTYRIWRNMINRCHYPKYAERHYYSGRGIIVCDKWRNSFQDFLNDMGVAPDNLSIDRIDNDGNYEQSNCRWATSKEQSANRTKGNRYISPRGHGPE